MEANEELQFQQLLKLLLSGENNVRQEAETQYNALPVEVRVKHLLAALHNDGLAEESKLMAAVILRRLFSSEFLDFYNPLSNEVKEQFLTQVLLAVQKPEITPNARRKISDVVAEVARILIGENIQWPAFLQFLFHGANSPNPQLQEAALRCFTSVPSVFGNTENQYLVLIKQMLQKSMDPSSSTEVRFQAVRATVAFILFYEKQTNIVKNFVDLLPCMLLIIADSIQEQSDQTLLKLLIEICETCPKFLRSQLDNIFDMCIKVLANADIEDTWRHLVLEVIVSLSENAAPMVRKHADHHIRVLIPLILEMMSDLEDDDEWCVSDQASEDDASDNNIISESALDRLACGLGGKIILPHVVNNIPIMLSNPDWKKRHAALMAISAIGEGCHKQMEAMLDELMRGIVNFLQDPHPRVRYAACNAVGQMSTDFAPSFEKKYHEQVVPGLLQLLDDVANPRVQAHAGAALVNFSEDCPKHILTRYLNAIMLKLDGILSSKFKELVEKGTKLVLEQVVTTIASVADTSEKDFTIYYDRFMPCLKYIIENATSEDLRMLRGKTIECVSLIGLAVGREKFLGDASAVMDMLLKTHTENELADDDPQTSYLISAWARMCKLLGKQFEQYLPLVMGPVMKTASLKPDVALLDNDEVDGIEGDVDWSFITLGEHQNFAIRTVGMEDKASACEMLVCYARELKEGFADYAEEVVKLMVPMLKFYFHDGVRSAAAVSLPYLLECGKIKGITYLQGMWLYICPELLKAIASEPEAEVLAELLHSLGRCIEVLGSNCLSDEAMEEVLKLINKFMAEHFEKADKRALARNEEDYDDGVEEQLAEEDEADIYQLSRIADIVHALFSTQKIAFLPLFDKIIENFVKLLDPARSWTDHQWGLCVFDDLIEFTGPLCAQYQQYFLQPLMAYVNNSSPEVRQAAAYGCGVMGQFAGVQFAMTCAQALPLLYKLISEPDSKEQANINATENSISAVTKILKYNSSAISNVNDAIALWFSWLPVVEDEDEAGHVYGYLCDLIQANHPAILGPNNSNLPHIVSIIAEAFTVEVISPQSVEGSRMLALVKQIETNASVFQACLSVLTEEQKRGLEQAYQSVGSTST